MAEKMRAKRRREDACRATVGRYESLREALNDAVDADLRVVYVLNLLTSGKYARRQQFMYVKELRQALINRKAANLQAWGAMHHKFKMVQGRAVLPTP